VFFRQILHEDLGCASYFIASRGEAVVVDPKWEIDDYLRAAVEADANILHVLETHFHADHVSGRRKLIDATGATPNLPFDPQRPDAGGLRDGAKLPVGHAQLTVISAPGHRPEHLAFLLTGPTAPPLLLSGDSLLIGALARPDLAIDAVEGSRELWSTVKRLAALGDDVEVWPAHVGASLCGSGALTERTHSTIGEELRSNPQLSLPDEDAFVQELTRTTPARPPRVPQVVTSNLGELQLLDVRDQPEWHSGHVAGSTHLPLHRLGDGSDARFPDQRPLAVACAAGARAALAASILRRRGHDGVLRLAGGVADLADRGVPLVAGDR
jgi:glyoxylase-like metal-dependent hydrolase (beta-lactamase superfamily II)/rhodanese-related sulfurtransferase